jgi:hypothetical protein
MSNVQGTGKCSDETSIVVETKNVFDRAPPVSTRLRSPRTGYNLQYADPCGRLH